MKRPTLKLSFIVALVLLKCVASQQEASPKAEGSAVAVPEALPSAQQTPTTPESSPPPVVNPPAEQSTPVATVNPPTTTEAKPEPTKTTDAPVVPVVPSSTTPNNPAATTTKKDTNDPISDTPITPSNSRAPGGSNKSQQNSNIYSATGSVTGSVPSATPSNGGGTTASDSESTSSSKTAIIAGSVVGGIVALAFVAGLITWLNRRGGCTSRTRRRDNQNFDSHDNEYDLKMTDNHNLGDAAVAGGAGAGLGMAAAGGAMHSSDNLPPSPFQHARRFVPPTSNPSGYMNLTDEEYSYQNNQHTGYQPQGYQDYNNAAVGEYNNYQQGGSHPDYSQDYQHDYHQQQQYGHQEYVANEYDTGYQQQGYYNQAIPPPGSNVTSPTLTNVTPNDGYRQQLKPDQIEQKPNAA